LIELDGIGRQATELNALICCHTTENKQTSDHMNITLTSATR